MELEINLHHGIGDVKFDMLINEVVAILGQADEVENISNASDESATVLRYTELGLTLFFEGDNEMLTCMDISNEDCTLFNTQIADLNEQELCQLLKKNGFAELDIEDEDWGERRISYLPGNIDFYFEDNELLSISIGK